MAYRYIDDLHRSQRYGVSVERCLATAALDQKHLVQPGVAVHGQHPVMHNRARRNRLAMYDVGQIPGLAEEVVDPDGWR
jgi:hypothetical protein